MLLEYETKNIKKYFFEGLIVYHSGTKLIMQAIEYFL